MAAENGRSSGEAPSDEPKKPHAPSRLLVLVSIVFVALILLVAGVPRKRKRPVCTRRPTAAEARAREAVNIRSYLDHLRSEAAEDPNTRGLAPDHFKPSSQRAPQASANVTNGGE